MLKPDSTTMTREEYLAQSPGWERRHEWINGRVYAMGGGTPRHAAMTATLTGMLHVALDGGPCLPTSGDQRVHVPATGASLYPDVTVICGDYALDPDDPLAVTNPTVLFEVLSPSTADYDRGAKWDHYRRLGSLQAYVLVDPASPRVSVFERVARGWLFRDLEADGALELECLGISVDLAALYARVARVP